MAEPATLADPIIEHTSQWLASALRRGLAATRVRGSAEHFGNVGAIVRVAHRTRSQWNARDIAASDCNGEAVGACTGRTNSREWSGCDRSSGGISMGVLVVEAAAYSGTRVSALRARAGRDVYADPRSVTNKNSWGPNTLIKQRAKLTAAWEDIWEELAESTRLALMPSGADASQTGETASLFPEQTKLSPHERAAFTAFFGPMSRSTSMKS